MEWNLSRVVALCAMSFFGLMSYAFSRPTIEAILTDAHGKEGLLDAWLMMSVAAVVVVMLYNRIAGVLKPIELFSLSMGVTLGLLLILQLMDQAGVPGTPYMLFIWKDLYIVFLVEIFWTYANSVFPPKQARWAYGLFLFMGSLGGISGNLMVKPFALEYGAESVLWLVFPALLLAWGACLFIDRVAPDVATRPRDKGGGRFGEGLKVIGESRYMTLLLLLIACTQVAITLIDYEYNVALLEAYPVKDVRAGVGGQVYAAIDASALILQLLTGPVLAFVGIPRTMLGIPLVLASAVALFFAVPQFLTMAVAKVASKCFDYSLFRAAKEILYIPLSPLERVQGKAVVDILAYRVTKGAVTLFLKGALAIISISWLIMGLTLGVISGWIFITWLMLDAHKKRLAAQEETPDAA